MMKRLFFLLTALLTLSVGMWAQTQSVTYIDENGDAQTATATEVHNSTTALNAGWYVVANDVLISEGVICKGNVHLILADGAELRATGGDDQAGIQVSGEGNSLSIYGQTAQAGRLIATGGPFAAGIGGGNNGSGSYITINGGEVKATGGQFEASGGGGIVMKDEAQSGASAGIGGGRYSSGSDIFVATEFIIRAGNDNPPATVIAADRTAETDIAGDLDGKRYATVRIPQGGIVTYGEYITVSPQFASGDRVASDTDVTFTAEDRYADNYEFVGFYKESTFENKITNGVSGLTYTATVLDDDISVYAKYKEFTPTPYIDADGQEQSVKTTEITTGTSTLNAGWYVVTGEVSRGNITCNGAVRLILADGAKLTATGGNNQAGITVSGDGNSLTIYGQTAQSGQLIAKGGIHAAGIGGEYTHGSNITINGGRVTATGGESAAGIGGGFDGSGSNITINGGSVSATGGESAAGIGGGFEQSGYDITINGGVITANGGQNAAGIGGGMNGSCSNIFVAAALTVYADNNNPPTTIIMHATGQDIASSVNKRHVIVKDDMTDVKDSAIAAINAAIEGVTNADIIAIAANAIAAINAATSADVINAIKEQALAAIAALKAAYSSGLGEMGEPCTDCPAVKVKKGDKTIILYTPEEVEFMKME